MRTSAKVVRRVAGAALLTVGVAACELPFSGSTPAETESAAVAESTEAEDEATDDSEDLTSVSAEELATEDEREDEQTDAEPTPAVGEDESVVQTSETAPEEPLVTVAGSEPFVEMEVLDLRRDGDAVTLVFSILIGEEENRVSTSWVFVGGPDQLGMASQEGTLGPSDPRRTSVSGVTLVDRDNNNRHLVLRESSGRCLCTRFEDSEPGRRYIHSAQFPAPPSDVTSMTVEVPQFPSVDNVPLREAS